MDALIPDLQAIVYRYVHELAYAPVMDELARVRPPLDHNPAYVIVGLVWSENYFMPVPLWLIDVRICAGIIYRMLVPTWSHSATLRRDWTGRAGAAP